MFNVASQVHAAPNLTPSHEFFQVIQNSTADFKNRLFTKARRAGRSTRSERAAWAQRALNTVGHHSPHHLSGLRHEAGAVEALRMDYCLSILEIRSTAFGRIRPDGRPFREISGYF